MNDVSTTERISFDVETSRILGILSSEIYDSPKAFLRENVQNAYDAILMRCTAQGLSLSERKIEIVLNNTTLTVRDDGIGMTEEVLRENFWKAGSSGKKTELAQRSGVIGTFGIGAMANFGVCTELRVETRHIESMQTLLSAARRDALKIGQDCIDLKRVVDDREAGTLIVAELDPEYSIDQDAVCAYLKQYVQFLPVAVIVNGKLISQERFENTLTGRAAGFREISKKQVSRGQFAGTLSVSLNSQNRVLVRLTDISLGGVSVEGEIFLSQQNGTTHSFRNLFGLAPVPISGHYNLSGLVNLSFLHPTAGREALSRDSIQKVALLVEMIEDSVTTDIAETEAADTNLQFQQYIVSNNLTRLGKNVSVRMLPEDTMIPLGRVMQYEPEKIKRYYQDQDPTVLRQFANEQANLCHISRDNPRRKIQIRYLTQITPLELVPNQAIIKRVSGTDLTFAEAMFLVRMRNILLEDYLMPDVDAAFADISHSVNIHVLKKGEIIELSIARSMPAVHMVLECYSTARDVFEGFMKDFVRAHLYPQIKDYVPSSTKQGRDALYQRLKEQKELFQLRESDYGEIEPLLADYLAGKVEFADVLKTSRSRTSVQRQHVSRSQVGSVEDELPEIISAAEIVVTSEGQGMLPPNEFDALPPIMRDDLKSEMKVLTVGSQHAKLNNFQMFLALSDRLVKSEGEFLRWPHTTKLIWGAHRVIYIFTDASGGLSLYYDIELRSPLHGEQTGGAMFPTTTIVTKNRIFVPVPKGLEAAFKIADGDREFYVRFDTIP